MKQILFYTDEARIHDDDLAALREADIIPIRVADPDAAKLVTAQGPTPINGDKLLAAAVQAISQYGGGFTKSQFVSDFARILTSAAKDSAPSSTG